MRVDDEVAHARWVVDAAVGKRKGKGVRLQNEAVVVPTDVKIGLAEKPGMTTTDTLEKSWESLFKGKANA